MSGGRSKTGLIFRKEMRVLVRDRRLVVGVVVGSLVVFPVLMALLGRIGRGGTGDEPVRVVLYNADDRLRSVAEEIGGIELWDGEVPPSADPERPRVSAGRGSGRYWIQARAAERSSWRIATALQSGLEARRVEAARAALEARGVDPALLEPYRIDLLDTSDPGDGSAAALAVLIPYLAILLLVSNAVRATYIAVGEKEHNTLASLLVTSIPRRSIVLGKALAVMTLAVASSVLLVLGMWILTRLGFAPPGLGEGGEFTLGWGQSLQVLVNLGALALLISGVIMVIGTFARTQREAGFYTAPLLFLSIFLAVFSFSPDPFPFGAYAAPILGNALAMRDSILGSGGWAGTGLPVAVDLACFVATIRVSVWMYGRETILFRP